MFKNISFTFIRSLYLSLAFTASLVSPFSNAGIIPSPPAINAKSYLLMDAKSGEFIVEHNIDDPLPPASLTKMMTAYIAAHEMQKGNVSLDDNVHISVKAWRTGMHDGSRTYIREGTKVGFESLLRGIIIQSGNDASVAVAEHIAGSEDAFVDLMNQHAKRLGMQNSNFVNSTGMPADNNFSTARDLALLARASIYDHPEFYRYYAEKSYTYNDIKQLNRNQLLWQDPAIDGLKTGYTKDAGYCLVASGERNGMRLISVVMGAKSTKSRIKESQKLLTYGFRFFESHHVYAAEEDITNGEIWMADTNSIRLGTKDSIDITIPRGDSDKLKALVKLDNIIKAPIEKGQQYGSLVLSLNGETLSQHPVVALESIPQGGFFTRIWHSIKLFFIGLFS